MPAFLEDVERLYGSRDLYEVLGVARTVEESELRRAYRRLSLRVHPDRAAPEDVETALVKFAFLHACAREDIHDLQLELTEAFQTGG